MYWNLLIVFQQFNTNFNPGSREIFTLNDYSAHFPKEVEIKLHKKGYFLIVIGGGITGDIQTNNTDYHRPLKSHYRENEMTLMVDQLKEDPNKIPSPTRNDMMNLFNDAWNQAYDQVDNVNVFKKNMVTIALDGSEDVLASRKLMDLVGKEMIEFRDKLLKSEPVTSLKELRKLMIEPEGVKYKHNHDGPAAP